MNLLKKKTELVAEAEADLLRRVRAGGPLARVELARQMQLAPSTVGIYVDRLVQDRLLRETGKDVREAGRPPSLLDLDPAGGNFVGVDFEAREIMAMAVDFAQNPLNEVRRRIGVSDSVDAILRKVEAAISAVISERGKAPLAIGVGAPGIVDAERGVILRYEFIKGWTNIALAERLEGRFGVPVHVENNVRSMAYGEMWFGQGRGVRDFVCLGIRSGVAAGIVVGGRLARGHGNGAGEIGRWLCPVSPGAGDVKDLEEIASVRAILREVDGQTGKTRGAAKSRASVRAAIRQVIQRADAGDPSAGRVLAGAAEAIGWTIAQLAPCLNPEKVIIAGPLAAAKNGFLASARRAAQRHLSRAGLEPPRIVNSELGEFAGALGAAALAVHRWKPVR
ncbi:MAG: ROK family protein [Kiritimatiellae bacterium]|nr:ROK family protein [Kiritimatiellia bacterium]